MTCAENAGFVQFSAMTFFVFDDDITDFSGLIKARTLGFRFLVSHDPSCAERS